MRGCRSALRRSTATAHTASVQNPGMTQETRTRAAKSRDKAPDSDAAPKTPTTADVIVYIKERLRRGELVPGQRLAEPDVMRETGASRGRVREALLRLSSDGLIVLNEFRGASVKRLARFEVKQIYDMREVLEGLAARLVATADLGKDAQKELQAHQRDLDDAVGKNSIPAFIAANERYHALIVRHADNEWLASALERLRIPLVRLQFHIFYAREAMERSNEDHKAITAAILAQDGRRAEAAMRAHVRASASTLAHVDDSYFA